jgi:hypothetical protein
MEFYRINVSDEQERRRWLRLQKDPLTPLRAYASAKSVLLSSAPAVYELRIRDGAAGRRSIGFRWTQHRGLPLPPIEGTIRAVRFGPFAILIVRGKYRFGSDPASRLLHQAVGPAMARRSLVNVLRALVLLLDERKASDSLSFTTAFPATPVDRGGS